MGKKRKKKSAKSKFRLLNINSEGELINKEGIISGETPRIAAMKAWGGHKSLNIVYLKNIDTGEEYEFNANEWFIKTRNGKRKFK